MGRPGSIVWLLRHELRLDFRKRMEARGRRRGLAILTGVGAPLFLAAFVGAPLGLALRQMDGSFGPQTSLIAAAALASTFMMMLSQALSAAVDALYERSDLDLLFASPVGPMRVVAVRALAIAFGAFAIFGFLATGPLLVIAALGRPGWLATLAVLFGTALAATGLALIMSFVLIRLVGPGRTRLIGHLLSVLLGSAFFLATQVSTIAQPFARTGWSDLALLPAVAGSPLLGLGLRALSGDLVALGVVAALQLGAFALGVAVAGPRFAALYAAAAGAGSRGASVATPVRGFHAGPFRAGLRKELRLLRRDPTLLPQIVLRVVYLAPLGLLVVRYGADADLTALPAGVMALTLMTHQLAGSLAWLTVSAEDAPDLLGSAPASERRLTRAKLAAATLVTGCVTIPAPLVLLAFAPLEAAIALGGCLAAAASASLLNVWWRRPGRRSAFRERASAPLYVTIAELALGLLIAGAAGLFAARQPVGAAPPAAALLILVTLRPAGCARARKQ